MGSFPPLSVKLHDVSVASRDAMDQTAFMHLLITPLAENPIHQFHAADPLGLRNGVENIDNFARTHAAKFNRQIVVRHQAAFFSISSAKSLSLMYKLKAQPEVAPVRSRQIVGWVEPTRSAMAESFSPEE